MVCMLYFGGDSRVAVYTPDGKVKARKIEVREDEGKNC